MEILDNRKIIIVAGSCTLKELFSFNNNYNISIPDYQRPYVWDKEKIEALISDLKFHIKQQTENHYYLGSILFYKNDSEIENKYEIIDGQQRLTSFLILDYVTNQDNSILQQHKDKLHFHFNSPISQKSIIDIKNYLLQSQKEWLDNNWNTVRDKLVVSVIVTNSQDEAFAFFETQNNRGVKLSPVDFLKSYHLRELKSDEPKQAVFAKKWDQNNQNQFLDGLYSRILWRSRSWRGKQVNYENNDAILNEFQKKSIKSCKNKLDTVSVFPTLKNKMAQSLKFDENEGIILQTSPIALQAKAVDYPFALRQPLEKGVGFFLYTEKYTELYHHLFNKTYREKTELGQFQNFFEKIYVESRMSEYFVELFRLCSIAFYDKFESNQLLKFAKHLDYFIGAHRIKLDSIVAQTPVKILRDENQNLLDIISNAFIPEEILDFIINNTDDNIYAYENIEIDNRVKGRYKKALLEYYNIELTKNLTLKKDWI